MLNILEQVERIAREWREFAAEHGETAEYTTDDLTVRCYFADRGDHTDVAFRRGYRDVISVAFHSPPKFNGLSLDSAGGIEWLVEEAAAMLADHKRARAERDEEEREAEKQARIHSLREKLAALESAA